jgi:non-lysosomal glucosylceramidase
MPAMSRAESSEPFRYEGPRTRAISFPLGGIGTGCIGLSGTGRLVDWEIFNRPNKNGHNGFSFFALRAERDGAVEFARVLHGDFGGPWSGEGETLYRGFGFGVGRETMAGFPHFKNTHFVGKFPIAEVSFFDDTVPCDVTLTAFNPFIPMNEEDSSLPAAILVYHVVNRSSTALALTLAGALANPFLREPVNTYLARDGMRAIRLGSHGYDDDAPEYGDMCLSTDAADVTWQEYWYRGEWFDNITVFWRDFCTPGPLANRTFSSARAEGAISTYNIQDECVLGVTRTLRPGESADFRFAITWSFPNFVNYWNPGALPPGGRRPQWKNHYATCFPDSTESARHVWDNYERLSGDTRMFQESLFATTLPASVIDAVSANLSIMKSPTCVRLTDGTLYGFEGCHAKEGCCEGSCTHVWNYEQAFPFLFPSLARSMRVMEYRHCQFPNGKMAFRMLLPPERTLAEKSRLAGPGRAAADGQMGGIIKTYREWRISGDTEWLRGLWPRVKKALEYAWEPTNEDWWDKDHDGVMEGVQHHTLDVEIYGPNTYITSQYLAALLAAGEMADAVGDPAAAGYRALGARGRTWVESNLFNGEYFHQKIDLHDRRFPVDPELGEIKYQIAEGCHIDQVLGQWHAHLVGLGYILDPEKVRSAVQAIYRHNFLSMRDHANPNRIYALDDEKGLVICTWPRGGAPKVPVPYSGECMNGYEYQAAIHMIIEGFVSQGLEAVGALRSRYDGERRNPWNEFECGSNYARSMASYALLTALSGFEYDTRRGLIGFSPRWGEGAFRCFWALNRGWGDFFHDPGGTLGVVVRRGELKITTFRSTLLEGRTVRRVAVDETPVGFHAEGPLVRFSGELALGPNQRLGIEYE